MGIRSSVVCRAALACALAFILAGLTVPAVAFAADAKFYSKKPTPSSTTTTDMPKVAVYIVDRYGIKYSSNFRIYIDGVRKTPKISYKSRYKKIWIAYYTKTKYKAGAHKVIVKVKNVRGHWSTTYWYFRVPKSAPPPPPEPPAPQPMPITIESVQCHACHVDTSWHPMNDCQQCHGPGRPVSWSSYTPADESAHTPGCAIEQPCHGGGYPFPHVLWSDCTRCHNGSYDGVAPSHAVEAEPAHLSSSSLCTKSGCHVSSLTEEHYRYTSGGARLTCATCHSSTDRRVRLALESGSTRCEGCHALTTAHVAPTTLHTVSGGCVIAGCHGSSAIAIHGATGGPGCAACHASTRTASLACANCHPGDVSAVHESAAVAHSAVNATCITSLCHAADVATLHGKDTGPGCVACHGAGMTPSTSCQVCHPGTVETLHPNVGPAHTAPVSGCVTPSCHVTDVMALHNGTGIPGCGACHKAGTAPTIVCTSCHGGDIETFHPGLAAKHNAAAGICTMAGCHGTKVSSTHDATGGPGCIACHAEGKRPSTTCATCHVTDDRVGTLHRKMAVAHVATQPDCVSSTCHAFNVGDLHSAVGCTVCHSTTGATVACASCHGAVPRTRHSFAASAHLATSGTCISALCHVSDVITLHTKTGGPGCAACHATGKTASLVCGSCHAGDVESVHPNIGAAHTAPASGCVGATCHLTNVTTLHNGSGSPGCGACHLAGNTPTIACASCHAGDLTPRHPWAAVRHAGVNPGCQTAVCHVTDIAKVHATGQGCVDCHGPGKTPSASCAACHPADIPSLHSRFATRHTAPAGTCVSSVCHGTSATTLHKDLALQGCPACHSIGKTATLACRTCHTTTLVSLHATVAASAHTAPASTCVQAGCHGANVATLHAALAGEGCSSCHVVGKTLTQVCTSCHSGDLTPRHPSATAAHTAPSSSCVTGGCHVSNVGTLHSKTGGPGCAACHAPGKTPSLVCSNCHADGAGLHPGAAAAHTAPAGTCVHTGCHVTDAAWLHTRTGGPGCAACHVTGKSLTLVCVTCHTGDLTPRHAFADADHAAAPGTCVGPTCHVSNAATTHSTGLGCVDCHGLGKTPSLLCGTCHTAPVLALHPQSTVKHTAAAGLCTSCHGTDSAGAHTKTGCVACHAAGKTPSTVCATCHSSTLSTWHSAPTAKHTAAAGGCVTGGCHVSDAVALHTKTGGPGCAACHALGKTASLTCSACHAGDMAALHPNAAVSHTGSGGCQGTNCHATDVSSLHGVTGGPGCGACHATGKTASVSCYNCHPSISTVHADGTVPHTVVNACTNASCHVHSTNVTTLHRYAPRGCRSCHTAGVDAVSTCATCHPGDTTSVHLAAIGTKHTTAYGSCVTTVCHNRDVASLHTKADGPGCGACHATGVTPSLVCANCHTNGFPPTHPAPVSAHTSTTEACVQPGCHASNAATLHTAAGGPGCAACHSAGVTATLNCVTCHHLGLSERHPSGAVPHTVNEHPCTGSSCHGTNAVTIHEQDQWSCWVCHDNDTGQAATNACADCHSYAWASRHSSAGAFDYHGAKIGTGYVDDWFYRSEGYIKAPYTRGWKFTCADCHVPTGTTNVFDFPLVINGTPVTVTNRQTQLQNMCIACHGGTVDQWHAGCFDMCHAGGHGGDLDFSGQDCSRCHQHVIGNWPHSIGGMPGPTL